MGEEKSKFNMSQLILFRISGIIDVATKHYRAGRLQEWFYEWRNVKYQIIGKIGEEDRKVLLDLELEISRERDKDKKFCLIEKYMINILDLMEKTEIGLASKSDETVFA